MFRKKKQKKARVKQYIDPLLHSIEKLGQAVFFANKKGLLYSFLVTWAVFYIWSVGATIRTYIHVKGL